MIGEGACAFWQRSRPWRLCSRRASRSSSLGERLADRGDSRHRCRRARRLARDEASRGAASGTSVEADGAGLWRATTAGRTAVIEWERPFGVTLLASYGRPQALLAFTSPTRTRYVPVRIDERSELDDELLARIAVLANLDLVDGVANEAALMTSDASALVRFVEAKSHRALGRIYLSDGRGVPIWLDRGTLSVAGKTFDLTSQLEWRALMFHESAGQGAALYQATSIRQGGAEVVLVAPMPASIVPREANAHREASGASGGRSHVT